MDIVIGTPGRINDLIERGDLDLSGIETFGLSFPPDVAHSPTFSLTLFLLRLVLDEADQMMGADFRDQVEAIMKDTPKERQTFLFSATMPPAVK